MVGDKKKKIELELCKLQNFWSAPGLLQTQEFISPLYHPYKSCNEEPALGFGPFFFCNLLCIIIFSFLHHNFLLVIHSCVFYFYSGIMCIVRSRTSGELTSLFIYLLMAILRFAFSCPKINGKVLVISKMKHLYVIMSRL